MNTVNCMKPPFLQNGSQKGPLLCLFFCLFTLFPCYKASAVSLSLDPPNVQAGGTSTGTITNDSENDYLVSVSSSDGNKATVSASKVLVTRDGGQGTFTVYTKTQVSGSVTINADNASATLSIWPPVKEVVIDGSAHCNGETVGGYVDLQYNTSVGETLELTSATSHLTFDGSSRRSLYIPSGQSRATFQVTITNVTSATSGEIYVRDPANIDKYSFPATYLYPLLDRLIAPSPIVGGQVNPTVTLNLRCPAPADKVVILRSSNNSIIKPPDSIPVSTNQSQKTFQVTTYPVQGTTQVPVDITATLDGATISTRVYVSPPPRALVSDVQLPDKLCSGRSATGKVILSSTNHEDQVVTLQATLPDGTPAPVALSSSSYSVPSGVDNFSFTVTAGDTVADYTVRVNASSDIGGGNISSKSIDRQLKKPLSSLTIPSPNLCIGLSTQGYITLNCTAPSDTPVHLTCNPPSAVTFNESPVIVKAGSDTAGFSVTARGTTGPVIITGSLKGDSVSDQVSVGSVPINANWLYQAEGSVVGGVQLQGCAFPDGTLTCGWGCDQYANGPSTIQSLGCDMTVLCMALNASGVHSLPALKCRPRGLPITCSFDKENVVNNPRNLNEFMMEMGLGECTDIYENSMGGYDRANDVKRNETVRAASEGTRWFVPIAPPRDDIKLAHLLCQGFPVIVRVPSSHIRGGSHTVLVYDMEYDVTRPPLNLRFRIHDPGTTNAAFQWLDAYHTSNGALAYEFRGVIHPLPATSALENKSAETDIGGLDVHVDDAVEILITDPNGRKTGFDAVTKQTVYDIPNSGYYVDGVSDYDTGEAPWGVTRTVSIFQPTEGQYQFEITGVKSGDYNLLMQAYSRNGTPQPPKALQGAIDAGTTKTVNVPVNFAADLSVVVTAARPNPVPRGRNVVYTITVTNAGPGAVANAIVSNNLPSNLTFVSCDVTDGGICGGEGNNRTITFPLLNPSQTKFVTVIATVNSATTDGAVIANTVTISGNETDPNSDNNTASQNITVIARDNALTVTPPNVCNGASAIGTLTLVAPAPFDLPIALSSDNPAVQVPAVIVPAGATLITFPISTTKVIAVTTANVIASDAYYGYSYPVPPAQLTVNPSFLNAFAVVPTTSCSLQPLQGTIGLTCTAPQQGTPITLTSDTMNVITPPQTVMVPSGQQSVSLGFVADVVPVSTVVTITASDGTASVPLTVTVQPPLAQLAFQPPKVFGGIGTTGTVTLTCAAPPGGLPVQLSSADNTVLGVPQRVTVPAGSTTATFAVTTTAVPYTRPVNVTATVVGVHQSNSVTVPITVAGPVRVWAQSPGPAHDGTSWQTAYQTVQAALEANDAVGGETWVASSLYTERITLRAGSKLLGGFSGIEQLRVQRDPARNGTIIDGDSKGSVVTVPTGAAADTILDGFTIRNGTGTVSSDDLLGGGIHATSASPTITNNVITNNSADMGAGIYVSDGQPIITNNTLMANAATGNGGGMELVRCTATITDNLIVGNNAFFGGGIDLDASAGSVSGNTIIDNGAYDGGGLFVYNASPGITSNVIRFNGAYDAGGAISLHKSASTVTDNSITGNSAFDGGGIYGYSAAPTIASNGISGNTAYNAGGGVYADRTSGAVIRDNVISSNLGDFGGGLFAQTASVTVNRNRIAENAVYFNGSAIYSVAGSPIISNNLVAKNTSPGASAAIYGQSGTPSLVNNTVVQNAGTLGAIYSDATTNPTIVNNIVAFNSAGIRLLGSFALHHNCVSGNTAFNYAPGLGPGPGDINIDPLFVSRTMGDYHLVIGSAGIDAGDNSVVAVGETDLDGSPRLEGMRVDMGAFEYGSVLRYTLADAISALRIDGGVAGAGSSDVDRLNVEKAGGSANRVDLLDATRLVRKVVGLEPNP